MPTAGDVTMVMKNRIHQEYHQLTLIRKEMERLAESYNRFTDLAEQKRQREQRIRILMGLLPYTEHSVSISQIESVPTGESHNNRVKELRDELPIWKAIREYLRVTRRAKVAEIASFLVAVGFVSNVTRQAIESAVKRHPQIFRLAKSGKDRFVSLK
jgi:hypothetical protein